MELTYLGPAFKSHGADGLFSEQAVMIPMVMV